MDASLYIHIPFCARRCRYCAFASGPYNHARVAAYLDALEREADARDDLARLRERPPTTIFVGGGTPTSLATEEMRQWLRVATRWGRADEFTVEANPGTATPEKLALLRSSGVNRLSVGVQTFDTDGLRILGRAHGPDEAASALRLTADAGFPNRSADLIAGWPGQTEASLADDIARVLGLGATHVSCYALAVEPGTRLGRDVAGNRAPPPDEERLRRLDDRAAETLARAGFRRYEVSNYAPRGRECRHNVRAWEGGEYLGLGAAAHSHRDGRRYANVRSTAAYVRRIMAGKAAEAFSERLSPARKARETAVTWLRLTDGIDAERFRALTGFSLDELYEVELPGLLASGGLLWDGGRLRLGNGVLPVADAVLSELV